MLGRFGRFIPLCELSNPINTIDIRKIKHRKTK